MAGPPGPLSVCIRHLQDLLPRALADHLGVILRDVRLDVLDLGLAFDVDAARAMHDLHVGPLTSSDENRGYSGVEDPQAHAVSSPARD